MKDTYEDVYVACISFKKSKKSPLFQLTCILEEVFVDLIGVGALRTATPIAFDCSESKE